MSHSSGIRSALGRVRGLGSAHTGTHHWWLERLTSLALIPLSIWFLIELMEHLGAPREVVALWIKQPLVSLVFVALIIALFWHVKLGLQVIIEDYVHTEGRKLALLLFKDLCIYALGAASLAAIAKLHFIGLPNG